MTRLLCRRAWLSKSCASAVSDTTFVLHDLKADLKQLSVWHNTVVIVPSSRAAEHWKDVADLVLSGAAAEDGVRRLKAGHVGLVVFVNRYDGIDLPNAACRILALVDLPEAEGLLQRTDAIQQGSEDGPGQRRQLQRIEQGMGRGIRSNRDWCLVFLFGTRLVRRLLSPPGGDLIGPATRAQVDLSGRLAKQLQGGGRAAIREATTSILSRDARWVATHKKAIAGVMSAARLRLDPLQVALRAAFDLMRERQAPDAAQLLRAAAAKGFRSRAARRRASR